MRQASKWSVYLLAFVCHQVYSTPVVGTDQRLTGYKAGHCPLMADMGQCSNVCIYDSDCEDDKKCCLNGCGGTSCVSPQQDPCLGYQCPKQGQSCISLLTHAVCLCNTQCPELYQPVCGDDGNTYSNKCYMDAHACELELTIAMVPCVPGQDNPDTPATEAPLSTDSIDEQIWPLPGVGEEDDVIDEESEDDDDDWDMEEDSDYTYLRPVTDEDATELLSTDAPLVNTSDVIEDDGGDTGLPSDEEKEEGDDDDADDSSDGDDDDTPGVPVLVSPPGEVVAYVGDAANIECNVKANPEPVIFWKKDELVMYPGQTYGTIFVSEKGILHFPSAQKEMTGNYLCIAANAAGSLAAVYALNVIDRPVTEASTTEEVVTTVRPDEGASQPTGSMDPVCYLPFDKGTCHQYIAVWTYNSEIQSCEVQAYGGCGGNANRFAEYEQCRATCPDMPTNQCEHPLETGPCRGYFPRWGWDKTLNDCVKFVYGGCLGNDNNFDRQEDCLSVCSSNEVIPVTEVLPEVPSVIDRVVPVSSLPDECEYCEPEKDLHDSYCNKDFVLSGTISSAITTSDDAITLAVQVDGLYKHGGLQVAQSENGVGVIRLTLKFNGECLCPSVSAGDTRYIIMGNVKDGLGMLDSAAYIRSYTSHRFTKLLHVKQNSIYVCNPLLNPYS